MTDGAEKKRRRRTVGAVGVFLLLSLLLVWGTGRVLTPHERAQNPEAFLLADYLDSTPGRDVVFLGDCEVFDSFVPPLLWEEYGINARVCGTPQQLLWHSEAILREVFRRENPSVVVLSVYGLRYATPQSEAYNRMALEALPLSVSKVKTVLRAKTEEESVLSYFVPLLRYHDRWQSLRVGDFTALFAEQEPISFGGYLLSAETEAGEYPNHKSAPPLTETGFGEEAAAALCRIVTLCREEGAQLVLVKAPTDSWRYPWYDAWEAATETLAEEYGLPYYNLLEDYGAIGLDPAADSRDGGCHLNVYGAEKLTRYFGAVLRDEFDLPDRRGTDETLDGEMEKMTERYAAAKKEAVP